jgi:hypothetical protein
VPIFLRKGADDEKAPEAGISFAPSNPSTGDTVDTDLALDLSNGRIY